MHVYINLPNDTSNSKFLKTWFDFSSQKVTSSILSTSVLINRSMDNKDLTFVRCTVAILFKIIKSMQDVRKKIKFMKNMFIHQSF